MEVTFVQLEVITRNLPIEVEKLMGISTPINARVMEFAYDRDNEICKVRVKGRTETATFSRKGLREGQRRRDVSGKC